MPINFPNSPSISQLYTYNDKTWEWNGTYWEVYSALTSYITSAYTVGNGYSDISGVTNGNIALKGFSGINISIIDSSDTLTFSGSPEFTGNTSASCITDLYVTNVYGCSPITIHDSVQIAGSGNIGVLSVAFGTGSESIGDYSFVQGESSATGEYGYNSTSIVSGVITLDAIYGDVTTQFLADIVLDDFKYDNLYGVIYTRIQSIIFNGTNTVITLNDVSITTTQAHIGSDIFTYPSGSSVYVGGHFSNAEGKNSFSISMYSHSEGAQTKTFGANSHSEGANSISIGIGSHSEGFTTLTTGIYSHSEGYTTTASGNYSHAEGNSSNSPGLYSHAEGFTTTSQGDYSHSEGNQANSQGLYSHAEGNTTQAIGNHSHSEGSGSRSYGDSSHSEGDNTIARGASSHSEGNSTATFGDFSHAEGGSSKTGQFGYYSSEISLGVISLDSSYGDVTAEFGSEIVLDDYLYDNIYSVSIFSISAVTFNGVKTIITLNNTTVSTTQARIGVVGVTSPSAADQLLGGYYSHAEGDGTLSLGPYSHSQGKQTTTLKVGSFSSGFRSNAFGDYSFIHSYNSTVNGANSVVLGGQNITGNTDDTVYVPNLDVRDNLVVSGNSTLQSFSATSGFISGSAQNILTVVGSGDSTSSPIFSVSGATGELLGIYDSLTGSLLSVSDSSNNSIFEVNSDSTILMGNYQALSLNSTTKVSVPSGTTTNIYSIPTSAYTGAFFEYTVSGGTNLRAGCIMSVFDSSNVNFTESTTTSLGSTSDINFNMTISSGDVVLSASATTTDWIVKTIIRSI